MRHILSVFTAVLAFLGLSNSLHAASASWRCEFPVYGEPITYIVELGTGKGKVVGNIGVSDVWVVEGTVAISFVEPLQSGAVQLTTIVRKTGEAAHSRNTVISGVDKFIPTQAAGQRKPWN
jgi:hypothetical protein